VTDRRQRVPTVSAGLSDIDLTLPRKVHPKCTHSDDDKATKVDRPANQHCREETASTSPSSSTGSRGKEETASPKNRRLTHEVRLHGSVRDLTFLAVENSIC
jgi:hypothetical protein